MTRWLPVLASVLALVVLACGRNEPAEDARGEAIRPEWGVVLPLREGQKLLETCARPSPLELSGRWNPERSEINRLEMRLPAVLGKALAQVILEEPETLPRTSDYYRQYAGFYRNGRRVVFVCGIHRAFVERLEPQTWTRTAMGVDDGGTAVFGAVYDVDADAFGPVQFEGRFSGPVRMRPS